MHSCQLTLLFLSLILHLSFGYFEVDLIDGRLIEGSVLNFENVRVKKINHTIYAGIGQLKVNDEVDNSYEVIINFYKKQGNDYKLTPFKNGPHKFCDYFQKESMVYDELLQCSDLPQKEVCPWPKGTYNFNKCTISMDKFPKYFEGDYRVDFKVSRDGEIVGGYQIFINIINF